MTISRTQRVASTSGSAFGTGAYTPASFTPSANSLLVVVAMAITTADGGMRGTDLTITDSAGLTWTSRAATTGSPAWSYGIRIWTAPVGSSPVSMTISIDCGAFSVEHYRVEAFDYTSDIGQCIAAATAIGTDADGDGAASITLSAAPASASHVLGACFTGLASGTGTITAGSDFTEINDSTVGGWSIHQTQSRTGSTSTTVGWDDVCATGTPFGGSALAALEIAEQASGTPNQTGTRFGADDGTESAHTWLAAQDTDVTAPLDENILLRLQIAAAGDVGAAAYELRYLKNAASGAYAAVPVGATKRTPCAQPTSATVTTVGTAAATWTLNRPSASNGDLVVYVIAWDDSTAVTSVTAPAGPNGESAVSIAGPVASASTEMRMQAWYYAATGTWSGGTSNWTPAAAETCRAVAFVIPSGEFDSTDPIGWSNTAASAGTAETNINSPTGTAESTDNGGRLFIGFGSDVDAITAPASGTTTVNNATGGGVGLCVVSRNTQVSASESVASITATIAGDSWASLAFVVKGVLSDNEVFVSPSANWNYNGGEDTTARLTPPAGSPSYTFVQGRRWDDENGTDSLSLNDLQYTEVEWSLQAQSPAANGDVFEFALFKGGVLVSPTTGFAQWTIGSSGLSIAADRGRLVFRGREVGLSLTSTAEITADRGRLVLRGRTVTLSSVQPTSRGQIRFRGRDVDLLLVSDQARGRIAFRGREVGLNLQADLTIAAERGQLRFRGRVVGLTIGANLTIAAARGRVAWRGREVGLALTQDLLLGATPGRVAYRGREVGLTLEQDLFLPAAPGRLVWRGREVGLAVSNDLFAPVARGRLALRGRDVGLALTADLFATAQPGRIAYRGRNVGLTITEEGVLPASPGRIVYRGREVGLSLQQDLPLPASRGRIRWAGREVGLNLTADQFLAAEVGRLVWRGREVGLDITLNVSIQTDRGRIVWRGRDVGLSFGGAVSITAEPGRLVWRGREVGLQIAAAATESVLDPKFLAKRRYQNIQVRGIEKPKRKKRVEPDLPEAPGQERPVRPSALLAGLFGRAGITPQAEPAPFVMPEVLPPAPTPVTIAPQPPVIRRPEPPVEPEEPEEPEPAPAPTPPEPPADPVGELREELWAVQAQLAITKAELEDRVRAVADQLQDSVGDLMETMRAEREAAQARIRDLEQQIERERKRAQQQRAAALAAAQLLRE